MVEKGKEKEEKKNAVGQSDREKAVDLAVAQIEKQFGKGAIMRLGKDIKINVPVIPTGALSLDLALGIGGIPRGRVIELFGPESSGKTTLTLSIIAETQKREGVAAFIDAEHAMDPGYARKLGVNLDDLLISQPDTGEQALEITEMLIRSNSIDLIVIDSVAALTPEAEIKGEMGQPTMGLHARLMSQALRKLTAAISKSKTCVIFINQIREKLGVMFGNPETTTGGRALKFYSSVRIDLRRRDVIKNGEVVIGSKIRAKVVKNKMAPPFREAEFDILFSEGIWKIGSLLDVAAELNVIQKSGSWLSFGEEKIGQGKENAAGFLKENPKILNEIEKKIHEKVAITV